MIMYLLSFLNETKRYDVFILKYFIKTNLSSNMETL